MSSPSTGLMPDDQYDHEPLPCLKCKGSGRQVEVRSACCGKLTPSGGCRGDCAVPEEFEVKCTICDGHGY